MTLHNPQTFIKKQETFRVPNSMYPKTEDKPAEVVVPAEPAKTEEK